jgi:hypothetical protein
LDEWRLIDAELVASVELDVAEWHVAPVDKVANAMENDMMGGWPSGEEGCW